MTSRPLTLIGMLLAILAAIFIFAPIGGNIVTILIVASLIFLSVANLTGR